MSFFSVIFDLVFYYFETISFFDKIINVASGKIDPSNKAIFITGKLSKPNTFLIYNWRRKVHRINRIELDFFNSKFLLIWNSYLFELAFCLSLRFDLRKLEQPFVLPLRTREGQPLSLLFLILILTHSSSWTCITFTVSVLITCQENSWDSHGENEC